MRIKTIEYLANILPDGHLSIPDEIKEKLKQLSRPKVRVSIKIKEQKRIKEHHPAFGIWADRIMDGSSAEIADRLRKTIENRADKTS